MHDGERRYTDEEFARILRMAAESRASSDQSRLRSGEGLTLSEMTQIAAEVGIDGALVQQAALRLAEGHPDRSTRILGGPARHTGRNTVPATLGPTDVAQVVDVIRDVIGQSGAVHEELGRWVWSSVGEPSQFRVSLAPGDGATEVAVSVDRNGALVLTWALPVIGGMVGAGIAGAITEPATLAGGVALFAGMTAGGLAVARTLWARGTKAVRRKIDRVLREAARAIEAASSSR